MDQKWLVEWAVESEVVDVVVTGMRLHIYRVPGHKEIPGNAIHSATEA